jgi:hypothetical protein
MVGENHTHSTHESSTMVEFILEVVTCYDCPKIIDPTGGIPVHMGAISVLRELVSAV